MLIGYILSWWYTAGWKIQLANIGRRVGKVGRAFSGGTLIRTMFRPWKQLVSDTERGASLNNQFRALIDNLVSRLVGFMMRFATLIAASVTIVVVFVVNLVIVVIWPLIPFAPLGLLIAWWVL